MDNPVGCKYYPGRGGVNMRTKMKESTQRLDTRYHAGDYVVPAQQALHLGLEAGLWAAAI